MLSKEEMDENYEVESEPTVRYCAYCGKLIEGSFFRVCDNFLQTHYFDSEEDNCFCSEGCILDSMFVKEIDVDENGNEIEDEW